jgi:hypothetical protein
MNSGALKLWSSFCSACRVFSVDVDNILVWKCEVYHIYKADCLQLFLSIICRRWPYISVSAYHWTTAELERIGRTQDKLILRNLM